MVAVIWFGEPGLHTYGKMVGRQVAFSEVRENVDPTNDFKQGKYCEVQRLSWSRMILLQYLSTNVMSNNIVR